MATVQDNYIRQVIQMGDEGSRLLAARTAPTLKNCMYADVVQDGMNGIAVLRIPKKFNLVVHSASGDPNKEDLREHSLSLVDRLVEQSREFCAEPLCFANVIDSRTGDIGTLETISAALVEKANRYKIAIMNGENAILGSRINGKANVSGTMISIQPKEKLGVGRYGANHSEWMVVDHEGKPVYMNSDGVGTKTEFYERAGNFGLALADSAAMKLDDAVKKGAKPLVIADVIETKGDIPISDIAAYVNLLMKRVGVPYLITYEAVGNRLQGYSEEADAYNVSGSVVSVIDEERLRNPPEPHVGEFLVTMRGKPNPRSNGITDKRKAMIEFFGEDWHKTRVGKIFLDYLAQPSTVLFPVFNELLEQHLATSFYHMSGGAYNGKLARPIAKHDLFVKIDNLFEPDWRELFFVGVSSTTPEVAYSKWPMGNDGFITTSSPDQAIKVIQKHDLEARVVGKLERATNDKSGVELRAFNGTSVYFPGK